MLTDPMFLVLAALGAHSGHARALALAPQSVAPGTFAVVTSDGFFISNEQSSVPLLFAPDSSFPGAPNFVRPAAEYERRSGRFLVASGAHLYSLEVTSLSAGTFVIRDITPQSVLPLDLFDLDMNPGSGELFLLDQASGAALRYPPPFAAGMVADLAIPLPGTSRSLAVDSRAYPPALVVGESSQITRVFFDGTTELVSAFSFASGVDQDPQYAGVMGTYLCGGNNDIVARATASQLLISMNYFQQCVPFALHPEDVEWDPIKPRAYVLGAEGLNQFCAGLGSGPNHVVRLPTAQSAVVQPEVMTFAGGSGITGLEGDIALVPDDFAFVAPYGEGCAGGSFSTASLDVAQIPKVGITSLTVNVAGATPSASVLLLMGGTRTAAPLSSGCLLLASPDVQLSLGTTNAQGGLSASLSLPGGLPVGTNVFLQAAISVGSGWELSNGLQVHIGE